MFTMRYRYRKSVYRIVVSQRRRGDDGTPAGMSVTVDGVPCRDGTIALVDDQHEHAVDVIVDGGSNAAV
jgi:hypothetical protein